MNGIRYIVFGVVSNIPEQKMYGENLIHWLHKRCGKSEDVHAIMKRIWLVAHCLRATLERTQPGGG